MIERLMVIGRVEFVSVARLRWLRIFAAVFALVAVATAWAAGSARELMGVDGFARTTVALVPLVVLLVPLVALLLGVTGQTTEPGADAFLFTQPVTRFEVLLGRWAGEAAALGCALAIGLGAGASVIALAAGLDDLPRFLLFAATTLGLALAFLSIGALLSAVVERRVVALAAAACVWFFFVLLFDALALAAAVRLTGQAGTRALIVSVFANPADLMRVLALTVAGTPHLLGAAGDAWHRVLGGAALAGILACLALALWTALPLAAARVAIRRRDL